MSRGPPCAVSCSTWSEPTPRSLPVASIAPAPPQKGWAGAVRLLEQIFPVAGKFLFRDNRRIYGLGAPAGRDDNRIANPGVGGWSEFQGWTIESIESLHQAEPGLLIDRERVTWYHAPVVAGDPDGFRLGDEITDRQHEAGFSDHRSASGPLLAQDLGGVGVFGN